MCGPPTSAFTPVLWFSRPVREDPGDLLKSRRAAMRVEAFSPGLCMETGGICLGWKGLTQCTSRRHPGTGPHCPCLALLEVLVLLSSGRACGLVGSVSWAPRDSAQKHAPPVTGSPWTRFPAPPWPDTGAGAPGERPASVATIQNAAG